MKTNNHKKPALEEQVERGSLFTHSALSKQAARLNEVESFLYAVIDVLTKKGLALPNEITQAVEQVRQEMIESQETSNPGLSLRVEEGHSPVNIVNCEERLPICKAVCCQLNFALTAKEVESGKIRWDLGRPYLIRQQKGCYCTHNNTKTKRCSIYDDRPSFCKTYNCSNDPRIWKDFKKMELNKEWIEENIKENKFQFHRAPMFTDEK